jgi:hypothetical protein
MYPCREREEEDFECSWWQGKSWPGPKFERRDHRCGGSRLPSRWLSPPAPVGHVVGWGAGALGHGFGQHVAVHSRGVFRLGDPANSARAQEESVVGNAQPVFGIW